MNNITFNTDSLQTYPDYYYEEPLSQEKKNNNPRYKFFKQNHYTAGDEDQFMEFWNIENSNNDIKKPILNESFILCENINWHKYKNLTMIDILNTFKFIFNKFKKGTYLKIVNGKGKVYLPFSKSDYQNEWSHVIKTNPNYFNNIYELMEYTARMENRSFVSSRVHKNIKSWYGNNGLVRLEFPTSEGDSGVNMIHDMIKTCINERCLSHFEGFINKRDFPLLKKNDTESYNAFYGDNTKLLSHLFPKYAPILSMTSSDLHADIPIPTWEDWCRVQYWYDGRMYGKEFRKFATPSEFDEIKWENKIETAIFRGASTGLGTTIHNNIRLQFSAESEKNICDDDGIPFLDVGISKWNLRPRKHPNSIYIETIMIDKLPFKIKPYMSTLDQCKYKYILHLPGHSEAYRLGYELYMGSVILYYPCEYQLWFFKWLKPWVHYVPLSGSIQDVYDKIKWCKQNDDKCKEIVMNARKFAHQYLDREPILDYLQKVFWELSSRTKNINYCHNNLLYLNNQLYNSSIDFFKQSIHNHLTLLSSYFNYINQNIHDISLFNPIIIQYLFQYNNYHISNLNLIKQGKNTLIYKFEYKNKFFVLKRNKNNWKNENKFHMNCAYHCINSLQLHSPHFSFTYYDYLNDDKHDIIMDYIEGNTLEYELNHNTLDLITLIHIYIILSLILYVAQQKHGFIHMDLYPWNIMIQKLNEPMEYKFFIHDKYLIIPFQYKITIIDYGKCHFIHNGINYYNTIPFLFCSIHDMISIIFSTLFLYIDKNENNLSFQESNLIINLMKFFDQSEYIGKTKLNTIFKIKLFLKHYKKFSKMLDTPKKGFEDFDILLFFQYLKNLIILNFSYHNESNIKYYLYFPQDSDLKSIFNQSIENHLIMISNNVDILQFRKNWIQNESLWVHYKNNSNYKNIYLYHCLKTNLDILFDFYKNKNIWNNLDSLDIKKFPNLTLRFDIKFDNDLLIYKLPKYSSHICPIHDLKTKSLNLDYNIFYLSKIYELINDKNFINIFSPIYKLACINTLNELRKINI
jgi:hypothetical protein